MRGFFYKKKSETKEQKYGAFSEKQRLPHFVIKVRARAHNTLPAIILITK